MSDSEVISIIAVLKAKPGKIDALKQALQALLLPTRREPGNIEYAPVPVTRHAGCILRTRILARSGRSGRAYRSATFPGVHSTNERSASRTATAGLSDADCAIK